MFRPHDLIMRDTHELAEIIMQGLHPHLATWLADERAHDLHRQAANVRATRHHRCG